VRATRRLLIGVFLLLIALPGVQMRFRFVPEVPLSGVLVEPARPPVTLRDWWDGELQSQAEEWFDAHVGRPRRETDNQIGQSLFTRRRRRPRLRCAGTADDGLRDACHRLRWPRTSR
jgi:hypothetical protein